MSDNQGAASQLGEDDARDFWKDARQKAEDGLADFTGQRFPVDPDARGFSGITFKKAVSFDRAVFEGLANFKAATFQENVNFQRSTFEHGVVFAETTFEGGANFAAATFGGEVSFSVSKWLGTNRWANFSEAVFRGVAEFRGCEFGVAVGFWKATFKEDAYFHRATFAQDAHFPETAFHAKAIFREARFNADAEFGEAQFKSYTDFSGASFGASAAFGGVTFGSEADFKRATFQSKAFFPGVRAASSVTFSLPGEKPRPFQCPEAEESAYRLAKKSAQQTGDYRRAGDYHYAEQCAINCQQRKGITARPWTLRFWWGEKSAVRAYPEYVFGRGVFGYGEKPLRPLGAGAAVIVVCALVYWLFSGACFTATREVAGFFDSVYFSIVTFTTLGYGDLRPLATPFRLIAAGEALSGAVLMALFVVSLARRFTR